MALAANEINNYLVNDINRKQVKRELYLMTFREVSKAIRGSDKEVYEALRYSVDFSEKIACVRMSIARLVKESGVSRATLYRCLNSLEEKGLVRREKEPGYYCNTFWVSQELGLLNKTRKKEEFNYKQPHEPPYRLSSCSFDRSVFGVHSSDNTFQTSLTISSQPVSKERYRSLVSSIEKKINKKENFSLLDEQQKKDKGHVQPMNEKTKDSEPTADKKMMDAHQERDKKVRSDYSNNLDQGQKKEGKSTENKMNSTKSDYFENRTNREQPEKYGSKYNNNFTDIQPYIDVYHELCVPFGCPKIEKGSLNYRKAYTYLKNLQNALEKKGEPQLTPESFREFLKQSIAEQWFFILSGKHPVHVLLSVEHFFNQKDALNQKHKERQEIQRRLKEQERRLAESERLNDLKQKKMYADFLKKSQGEAPFQRPKRIYSKTCKNTLHGLMQSLTGRHIHAG